MNHRYFWTTWSISRTLSIPTFGLSRFFGIPQWFRFSCGIWVRFVADEVLTQLGETETKGKPGYRPLDSLQIRLLEFRLEDNILMSKSASSTSARSNILLRAKLVHVQLNNSCPEYEALSYVWGSSIPTRSIEIDGQMCCITQDLAEALEQIQIRTTKGVLHLWIDALCINQDNVGEKNEQVQRMHRIYGAAERVLVWLGRDTSDSPTGMEILEYLCHKDYPNQLTPWTREPPDVAFAGLSDIMNRPWFQRMWIVQEAVLSKDLQFLCGPYSLSWCSTDVLKVRSFSRMIKYAEISPSWEQAGLLKVNMAPLLELLDLQTGRQLDKAHGLSARGSHDLLDIAHSMRHKLTTDRRDMIFAIAGINEGGYSNYDFRPDYNWSAEEAYQHLLESVTF